MTRYGRADSKLPFPMLNFNTSVHKNLFIVLFVCSLNYINTVHVARQLRK